MSSDDARLIDAIHHDRLAALDHPEALAVCRTIGRSVADLTDDARSILMAAGIEVTVDGDPTTPTQRHSATLVLDDADQALAAADALAANGYRPWQPIHGPGGQVLRYLGNTLTMARTDEVTMVLDLRWPPSSVAARLPAALRPNENDFDAVSLPTTMWPLYLVVRPLRLVAERLGLRRSSGHVLGPFLSTPTDLIDPLLDLAGVSSDDTLVDLGCGDAGVLIEAVDRRGCRGVGVEANARLAAEARRRVDEAGLTASITIVEGDATAPRLPAEAAEGSVFFLFVPATAVPAVAGRLAAQAKPGSRLIVHEQHPLPEFDVAAETMSVPLLAGRGVTVAHRIVFAGGHDPTGDRGRDAPPEG